jgi:hypothetical protein
VAAKQYTVFWPKKAEGQLAFIWAMAPDRAAVAEAADALDGTLAVDPHDVGESRADGYRIEVRGVLAIIFTTSEPDRTVSVVAVWLVDRGD